MNLRSILRLAYQLAFISVLFVSKGQTTWTIMNKTNSLLPSDTVNVIAIDKFGVKWIGTENGLAKLNGTTWTIYKKTTSGIPSNKVSSLTIDSLGNIWVGTRGAGLAMFNGTTWTLFNASNSLVLGKNIGGVIIDSLNNKWVASNVLTQLGATNQSVGAWSVPYCTSTAMDTVLTTIALETNTIKWIGSTVEAISYCSSYINKLNVGPINTIIRRKSNDLWFGGDVGFFISGNISCFSFSFGLYYPSSMGLSDNKVSAIAFDNCSNAWIGTKTGGLGRYTGVAATSTVVYTTSNSLLPSNKIKTIAVRGTEKWIGTTAGVAVLNSPCPLSTGINEDAVNESALEIYPNPSSGNITIKLQDINSSKIIILDLLGKEVYSSVLTKEIHEIDLSPLPNGIYFVGVKKPTGISFSKIVKE